ncbi:hypothetical protein KFE25_002204 [Diacronema lutheri]|uniref:RNA polymerase sigma-70 domain-containing protein n=1 Tax=Diacronema lutheri TaxID=2081491 RepID=A0A8J6CG84_DIALT|nr:hypothetical protein KFE25_002204 [Diacronema lutheri]
MPLRSVAACALCALAVGANHPAQLPPQMGRAGSARMRAAASRRPPICARGDDELSWLCVNMPEPARCIADRTDASLARDVALGHRRWLASCEALAPRARLPGWNASVASRSVFPRLDDAQSRLLLANMGLVISLSKRYVGKGVSLSDLVQEGSLGLLHAMHKYDPSRNVKFVTYAYSWVAHFMASAVATKGNSIRLPTNVHEGARRMRRARRELIVEGHAAPSDEAIAQRARLPLRQIATLNAVPSVVSLDARVGARSAAAAGASARSRHFSISDLIADEQQRAPEQVLHRRMVRQQLDLLLGETLGPVDQRIVRLRYGLDGGRPKKLIDIGRELKLEPKTVHRVQKVALAKLRKRLDKQLDGSPPPPPPPPTLRAELELRGVRMGAVLASERLVGGGRAATVRREPARGEAAPANPPTAPSTL